MIELAAAGMTDYAAIPLSSLDTRNVITITTKVAGGFAEAEIDCLIRLFKLFALHVQRHSELKISENALGAYLGYGAAAKVLEGAIKRGAGDSVRAVIWDRTIRVASDAEGCHLLRAGMVLHEGAVFFGNVGAPDRPDFTVIGAAVNEACRVEALTKTIGRDLLMTEAVARHVPQDVEHLGEHQLRGISARMSVYGLAG